MICHAFIRWGVLMAVLLCALAHPAYGQRAAGKITFIRDAEIEDTLRRWSTPIFQAAGLSPDGVNIYIIRDNSLNAFVAGGQNVFLNTGLLQRSENAEQVIGVIAHEVGHISGGHLSRLQSELANASATAIVGYILGAAAAVVGGSADAGAAILTGTSQIAERTLLSYSRTQERAADQAAVNFLASARISPRGLLEFMRILDEESLWRRGNQNPYIRTHPLTTERIRFLENQVAGSPLKDTPLPRQFALEHARIVGKLNGFLDSPLSILQPLRGKADKSLAEAYTTAIALYRLPDLTAGDAAMQPLFKAFPDDPYFLELQGQMYLEAGDALKAEAFYQRALAKQPDSVLIRFGTARALISNASENDTTRLTAARSHLLFVTTREPRNASAWRSLSIVHGRLGDIGLAQLALAEEAYARDDIEQLRFQLARAEKMLDNTVNAWNRLQELRKYADDQKDN